MTLESPSKEAAERYARHLALEGFGVAGQARLKAARVLVVGAGGLGSPAALYLAAAGLGTLGLVDCDAVELSNLQRQVLFATADVGRAKTVAAAERLRAIDPGLIVECHDLELTADNVLDLVRGYDVILDGTDRVGTRYLVNDACVLTGKPLVSAAIHRFEGQAMTYIPGKGPCYRCLFPEPATGIANCVTAGVLGVLPGVLGTLQATEAIKLIVGLGEPLVGRLLVYDALTLRFQEYAFRRRGDCTACGDAPQIGQDSLGRLVGGLVGPVVGLSADGGPVRLLPAELQARLRDDPTLVLVDVREPHEFATWHLPRARNIPLGSLRARLRELPADSAPVFVCLRGARSETACALATAAGIAGATLEGGLLAWQATLGQHDQQ